MRICFWMTSLFSLGGTKRVVTLVANELAKTHDVTIMCHENRVKEDRTMYQLSDNIKVDFLNIYDYVDSTKMDPRNWWRLAVLKANDKWGTFNRESCAELFADAAFPKRGRKKLEAYINSKHYDVVIATARMGYWLAMMAPNLNCKTIGWQHNCYDGYINIPHVLFWKQENILKVMLPKLDRYVVLSKYDQRDYEKKLGIKTTVMTNPRSFFSEKKTDSASKRFLVVTRFVYAKGLDMLLEAFKKFCEQDDEWEIDVLGDGQLFKKIVKSAEKMQLTDRIHFLGTVKNPQDYYLKSSVLLLPSRWEGWPMVIMEAYEFGLPVIAFHTGSMDLIIRDKETGLLPNAFNVHLYAKAMLRLAHDDQLRYRMSQNAIEESKKYDIQRIIKTWNDLLDEVVANEH